jgi:serine/threonine protein kinase
VSTVYKAICIQTQSKVIIKAYRKSKMQGKHFHKLHREIVVMKMLNGPYVAEFYDTFEDEHHVYIIMEYCEGGDLFKTMLMNGGLLDEHWVCVEVGGWAPSVVGSSQHHTHEQSPATCSHLERFAPVHDHPSTSP